MLALLQFLILVDDELSDKRIHENALDAKSLTVSMNLAYLALTAPEQKVYQKVYQSHQRVYQKAYRKAYQSADQSHLSF